MNTKPNLEIKICSVKGCVRNTTTAGMCGRHYQKYRAYGDPLAGRTNRSRGECTATCSTDGCNKRAKSRGLCSACYMWISKLTTKYGLTLDQYKSLLVNQNNSCAICEVPFIGRPAIDHDHETGLVRGLLCRECNSGIGFFMDSFHLVTKASQYLFKGRRWKCYEPLGLEVQIEDLSGG